MEKQLSTTLDITYPTAAGDAEQRLQKYPKTTPQMELDH